MSDEQLRNRAKEIWAKTPLHKVIDAMLAFAAEQVAAERARCAKACDELLTIQDIKEAIEKDAT